MQWRVETGTGYLPARKVSMNPASARKVKAQVEAEMKKASCSLNLNLDLNLSYNFPS
jgi:hypothetical protein